MPSRNCSEYLDGDQRHVTGRLTPLFWKAEIPLGGLLLDVYQHVGTRSLLQTCDLHLILESWRQCLQCVSGGGLLLLEQFMRCSVKGPIIRKMHFASVFLQ